VGGLRDDLRDLLEAVRAGTTSPDDALERLSELPFRDLGFARVDVHRELRQGAPEAVLAEGKTPEQVAQIEQRFAEDNRKFSRENRGSEKERRARRAKRVQERLEEWVGTLTKPQVERVRQFSDRVPLYDELRERDPARAAHRTDFTEVYFDDSQPVLSVVLEKGGVRERVAPEQIAICDLSDPDVPPATGWRRPDGAKGLEVGVDPVLGRIALPEDTEADGVEIAYAYGFPGDIGGGPYDRSASAATALADLPDPDEAAREQTAVTGGGNALQAAVGDWNALTRRTVGVIAVTDSRSYDGDLEIHVRAGSRLLIVAADWPADEEAIPTALPARRFGRLLPRGRRPHVSGAITVHGEPGSTLILDGLLLERPVTVADGDLALLRIAHCTLAPETAGVTVAAGNGSLAVELERTISGPVGLGPDAPRLRVRDCIVDGRGGDALKALEADADVQTSTIAGATSTRTLSAGNSIFTDVVTVKHRQTGCVRYCYLPLASVAARRFRCHPVDEAAADRIQPAFTSLDLRRAPSAYGQLADTCPAEIARGAEDEGEMGAFNFLKNPQRLSNLTTRMDEYLRFGLEAGVVFVT